MEVIVYRKNNRFIIDKSKINSENRVEEICNALYIAVYKEFQGAQNHPSYKNMTNLEKLQAVNDFASNWLSKRGLL